MRRLRPGVVYFLVTGLAGLGSHILGSFGRRRDGRGCAGGLGVLTSSLLGHLAGGKSDRDRKTQRGEQKKSTGSATKFVAHKFESLSFISTSRARSRPVTSLISWNCRDSNATRNSRAVHNCSSPKNQSVPPVRCELLSAGNESWESRLQIDFLVATGPVL